MVREQSSQALAAPFWSCWAGNIETGDQTGKEGLGPLSLLSNAKGSSSVQKIQHRLCKKLTGVSQPKAKETRDHVV